MITIFGSSIECALDYQTQLQKPEDFLFCTGERRTQTIFCRNMMNSKS